MHQSHGKWGPGRPPRGGGYFGRGGIKFAMLELLKEQPRHGYDIMREMEQRSGGTYSPSPGVIYPTLQALEDQDYVRSSEQDGKKVYSITDSGLAYLEGHKERMREHHGGGAHGESAAFWNWTGDKGRADSAGDEPPSGGTSEGAHSAGGASGGAAGGAGGAAFHAWFSPEEMPELMKELRWFFGDFAGALQRTIADPEKIEEIRVVLREAKRQIDDIVMR